MKHHLRKLSLEGWSAVVTIVGLPLLILSLLFAYVLDTRISAQLSELKQIAESQNNIALNTMVFDDSSNIGIIGAIENGQPIQEINGGRFTSAQLDKYLGDFDTVYTVYSEGLLNDDQLCDSFATYVEEAESNPEVHKYLTSNPSYFAGLPVLLSVVKNSNSTYCQ